MFIRGVINHNGIPFSVVAPPEKAYQVASEEAPKISREAVFGCMKGKMWMADDFDAPLEDFKEYME